VANSTLPWACSMAWVERDFGKEMLYLQPNSTKLSHPFGPWPDSYEKDYQWNWRIFPRMHILFFNQDWQLLAFSPMRQQTTHIVYQLNASQATFPLDMVPFTPVMFSTSIKVMLSISLIEHTLQLAHPVLPLPQHPNSHCTIYLGHIVMA